MGFMLENHLMFKKKKRTQAFQVRLIGGEAEREKSKSLNIMFWRDVARCF